MPGMPLIRIPPAVHLPGQKAPGARALCGGQLVLQPHAVPICLPAASLQFTLSQETRNLFRTIGRITTLQSASVYECLPFMWPYNARSVEVGSPNSPEVWFG